MNNRIFALCFVLLLCSCHLIMAQVGIGTTTPAGVLDVRSTNHGVLLPSIPLTNLNSASPIANPKGGAIETRTLIYHDGSNSLIAGYYYWDGSTWLRFLTEESSDWTITGNAGIDPATNFIGTNDSTDLSIRTFNLDRLRIQAYGDIGIGTENPQKKLHIADSDATIRIDAFNSTNSSNNNGTDLAPIAVNASGDLVVGDFTFASKILLDEDNTTFLNPNIRVVSNNDGSLKKQDLVTKNFSLTRETLVEIKYNIGVGVDDGDGVNNVIIDGMARTFGVIIDLNGTELESNGQFYTNGNAPGSWTGTTTFVIGDSTLTGSVYRVLAAGSHTLKIKGYCMGITNSNGDAAKVGISFGNSWSRLQIIRHN